MSLFLFTTHFFYDLECSMAVYIPTLIVFSISVSYLYFHLHHSEHKTVARYILHIWTSRDKFVSEVLTVFSSRKAFTFNVHMFVSCAVKTFVSVEFKTFLFLLMNNVSYYNDLYHFRPYVFLHKTCHTLHYSYVYKRDLSISFSLNMWSWFSTDVSYPVSRHILLFVYIFLRPPVGPQGHIS